MQQKLTKMLRVDGMLAKGGEFLLFQTEGRRYHCAHELFRHDNLQSSVLDFILHVVHVICI